VVKLFDKEGAWRPTSTDCYVHHQAARNYLLRVLVEDLNSYEEFRAPTSCNNIPCIASIDSQLCPTALLKRQTYFLP